MIPGRVICNYSAYRSQWSQKIDIRYYANECVYSGVRRGLNIQPPRPFQPIHVFQWFRPPRLVFFFFFVSAFKSDIIFAIAYYSRFDLACYSLLIGFQWDTRLDYVEYRRRCNVHVRFLWFGIVHGRSVLFEIEIYVSLCTEAGLRVVLLMFNGED